MRLSDNTFNTLSNGAAKNSHAMPDIVNKNNASVKNSEISFTGGIQSLRDEALAITAESIQKERDRYIDSFSRLIERNNIPKTAREIARDFITSTKARAIKFIKENVTEGTDIVYTDLSLVKSKLHENFGSTFDDCIGNFDAFNRHIAAPSNTSPAENLAHKLFHLNKGAKDRFIYIENEDKDFVTFHKDPFVKNVCFNIKEFVVGSLLDAGLGLRKAEKSLSARFGHGKVISPRDGRFRKFHELLNNREAEKEARDSYYRLMGAYEKAFEGVQEIKDKQVIPGSGNLGDEIKRKIVSNIQNLSRNSVKSALKKSGNYNTKTERAMNRLGTGFVSACFAANEYYNISMIQNNDPKKAEQAHRERLAQDMTRQGLTAGITYIVLGSLQKNVNKSVFAAVMSLGGVTLISEILSRKLRGVSLVPLSPEKARKKALKNSPEETNTEHINAKENDKEKPIQQNKITTPFNNLDLPVTLQKKDENELPETNPKYDIFKAFTDKIEYTPPINSENEVTTKTSFTTNKENTNKKAEKKKNGVFKMIGKILGGIVAATFVIGFLRTRNVLNIDEIIKSASAKYKDIIEKLTRKRLIMSKDDVDGFLKYLKDNHFEEQYKLLDEKLYNVTRHGAMNGQAETVRRFVPEKEINPEGLYYDLGYVESKGKKTAADFFTYPINCISKLSKKANELIKSIVCGRDPEPEKTGISQKEAVEFIEKYATKYRDAMIKGETFEFDREIKIALTKNLSEANSATNNATLAMLSRLLITFITGYFFVNDYRNKVLIESKGEDIEGANVMMKEKIGQKVLNFFLNSMFMDFFNTTFERAYLGSVAGATAVAMATEVTNETTVRSSMCQPLKKMNRDELIEYEQKRINEKGIKGAYYRGFMKLFGKKLLSEKAGEKAPKEKDAKEQADRNEKQNIKKL